MMPGEVGGKPGNRGNPLPPPPTKPTYTPYQERMLKKHGYVPTMCKGFKRGKDENGNRVRCKNWAVRGAEHCKVHGGQNRYTQRKKKKMLQDTHTARAMVTYGLPLSVSPHIALQEELARTNGHVKWLAEKIQSMESGQLVWGQIETSTRSGTADESNWDEEKLGAVLNLWVQLYFRERQHLARIADMMVKNGLSAVSLRLRERQIDLMEGALLTMAKELGHADDDPAVRAAMVVCLNQMASAAQEPLELEPIAPKKR